MRYFKLLNNVQTNKLKFIFKIYLQNIHLKNHV